MRDIGLVNSFGNLEVDSEGLQCRIGACQLDRNGVGRRIVAGATEAMHVDVDQASQLRHEVLDVHAGTTVDVRWPFSGQDRDSHVHTVVAR